MSNQPAESDAVLGGQAPKQAGVLGGIEGIKQRLKQSGLAQQLQALAEALKYGESGLNLVVQALNHPSEQVQNEAYQLLRQRPEPNIKHIIQVYNPYPVLENLWTLTQPRGFKRQVAITPDGELLVVRGDQEIQVLNVSTGREHFSLDGQAFAIAPSGRLLITGSFPTSAVWDLRTGQKMLTFSEYFGACLVCLPDEQTVIGCGNDSLIRVWNLQTGEQTQVLNGHRALVSELAISPDGQTIASGEANGAIKIWRNFQVIQSLQRQNSFSALVFADNHTLVFGNGNAIQVWNVEQAQTIQTLGGHTNHVSALAVTPNGRILVSGGLDGTVRIWNLRTGQELRTLHGHGHYILSVAISPDGQAIASASRDETLRFWAASG